MKKNTVMKIWDLYFTIGATELIERTVYSCGCTKDYEIVDEYNMESMCGTFDGTLRDYMIEELTGKYVTDYNNFYIEEDGILKNLIVEKHVDKPCHIHMNYIEKIYCIDMPRPEGFDDMELHHGICALSRTDLEEGVKHLVKVLEDPTYETCCSTDAIGLIGATFIAEVITASNIDLFTRVGENGHRYYELSRDAEEGIIHYASDIKPNEYGMNNEFVTINNKLQYIWVKTIADERYKEAAAFLAEKLGVEVKEFEPTQDDFDNDLYW